MDLKGAKAYVTGGSRGIGRAVVLELARCGADIAFVHREDAAMALATARKVGGLGRRCVVFDSQVADSRAAARCVTEAAGKLGGLDILVNNAGITADAVLWKMTDEQWDRVLAVNLKGCFNHIRAVAPIFRERKRGRIVNISSINGLRGKFGQSNYCASKAGLIGLTKAAARELGAFGVNVNCVAPGMVETEMTARLAADIRRKAVGETLLGRLGKPEDVAHLVAFLCGRRSGHITGQVIQVDGGQHL